LKKTQKAILSSREDIVNAKKKRVVEVRYMLAKKKYEEFSENVQKSLRRPFRLFVEDRSRFNISAGILKSRPMEIFSKSAKGGE
jgi:sulfite reductase beta subunit-like hemoprotein